MAEQADQPGAIELSPSEWRVMNVLWAYGPLAARDVFAALEGEPNWAHTTVKTLLSRLAAKGAVEYQQVGNSFLYRAAAERDQLTRQEVKSLFRRVVSEAVSPALAYFIEQAPLSEAEIHQLQQVLDRKRADLGVDAGGSVGFSGADSEPVEGQRP